PNTRAGRPGEVDETPQASRFPRGGVFPRIRCMSLFADGLTGTHERLLLAMLEGATDTIFLKDPRGRVLMVNRAGAARLGRPPEEIIGKDVQLLFGSTVLEQILRTDRLVLEAGGPVTFEQAVDGRGAPGTKTAWACE